MITALLLNYKRQNNLKIIIDRLKKQTIPITIFLWNNNYEDNERYDVDLQIDSSINLMCSPRWLMSGYSNNEYFFSLDDDLIFNDDSFIEQCHRYCKINNCAVGYQGVKLNKNKQYWTSNHLSPNPNKDINVDIIKGRFLFCSKQDLSKINFNNYPKKHNFRIEDDIILSSKILNKIIPKFAYNKFIELPAPHALMNQSDHKISRQWSIDKYYDNININTY